MWTEAADWSAPPQTWCYVRRGVEVSPARLLTGSHLYVTGLHHSGVSCCTTHAAKTNRLPAGGSHPPVQHSSAASPGFCSQKRALCLFFHFFIHFFSNYDFSFKFRHRLSSLWIGFPFPPGACDLWPQIVTLHTGCPFSHNVQDWNIELFFLQVLSGVTPGREWRFAATTELQTYRTR